MFQFDLAPTMEPKVAQGLLDTAALLVRRDTIRTGGRAEKRVYESYRSYGVFGRNIFIAEVFFIELFTLQLRTAFFVPIKPPARCDRKSVCCQKEMRHGQDGEEKGRIPPGFQATSQRTAKGQNKRGPHKSCQQARRARLSRVRKKVEIVAKILSIIATA